MLFPQPLPPFPEYVPPCTLQDLDHLPDEDVIGPALAFNLAYRAHLKARLEIEHHRKDTLERVYDENEELWTTWWILRESRFLYHSPEERCEYLETLRKRIGTDNYRWGTMPSPIPTWAFNDITR
jgi:hypothetical protein